MHWERFAGVRAIYCGVLRCTSPAELGAHVVKDGGADKDEYIVPMCQVHNGQGEVSLPLSTHVLMVHASVAKTCDAKKG